MSRPRSGYTLLELLLVLAVIASLMALAWPALTRRMSQNDLRQAAMEVTEALTEARLNAMESGEPWVFRYWPQTGQFEIGPLDRNPSTFLGGPAVPADQPAEANDVRNAIGQQLDQVQSEFADARNAGSDNTSQASLAELLGRDPTAYELEPDYLLVTQTSGSVSSGEWNETDDEEALAVLDNENDEPTSSSIAELWSSDQASWIIFDPLGRTEDLTLSVYSRREPWRVDLTVRGMTGAIAIGKPVRTIARDSFDGSSTLEQQVGGPDRSMDVDSNESFDFEVDRPELGLEGL